MVAAFRFAGLKDQEMRYRQRYIDLIANDPIRQKVRRTHVSLPPSI